MKSKSTAYLLWALSIFGILGFQHFYLGKTFKGIVWLLTGGILGIGAFVDLFTLGIAVDSHNTAEELKTIRAAAVHQVR
jgi:TM2 domain-containing membrane protein YozV